MQYTKISHMNPAERVEALTASLVSLSSVNGTVGEGTKADFIKEVITSYPYFQENPSHVWEQAIPNDPYKRKNIFAFIKGHGESRNTVIYHAHLDTVGIEDFGPLKDIAFDCEKLAEYFSRYEFDQDVQRDAKSGEWMFGRGSVDMQSGIAVHLANLLHFSENLETLPGNVLFMANPDEESQHSGILASISELNRLKKKNSFTIWLLLIRILLPRFTMVIRQDISIPEPRENCCLAFTFTGVKSMLAIHWQGLTQISFHLKSQAVSTITSIWQKRLKGSWFCPHPVCISVITRNPIMCKRLSAPACISIVLFMKEQQKK